MSFTEQVKSEICEQRPGAAHCTSALLYGFLLFSRYFFHPTRLFKTKSFETMEYTTRLLQTALEEIPHCVVSKGYEPIYSVSLSDEAKKEKLLGLYCHSLSQSTARIGTQNLPLECCFVAFLKGAFLSCGRVSDPKREYRLEFQVPHMKLAIDFLELLSENNILLKLTQRGGDYLCYTKESEQISDLLTLMGASASTLKLLSEKVYKEFRGSINRKTNVETANIEKTVRAAQSDVAAIRTLLESPVAAGMPDELLQLCRLRVEHPELSLSELAERLPGSLSRSGVYHRLQKIRELSREVEEDGR